MLNGQKKRQLEVIEVTANGDVVAVVAVERIKGEKGTVYTAWGRWIDDEGGRWESLLESVEQGDPKQFVEDPRLLALLATDGWY